MHGGRVWLPFPLSDSNARRFRISFRIAEEATWDHRFHDLDGREIDADELRLSPVELHSVQVSCDAVVGSRRITQARVAAE